MKPQWQNSDWQWKKQSMPRERVKGFLEQEPLKSANMQLCWTAPATNPPLPRQRAHGARAAESPHKHFHFKPL